MAGRDLVIDREKICPFLLRIYAGTSHQDPRDFSVDRLPPSRDEHVVYTWKDTTLRDIVVLLLSSDHGAKLIGANAARYSIRHVFSDESRGYIHRDIGFVFARDLNKTANDLRGAPSRTLASMNFVVGDFLDIALLQNQGGPTAFGGDRRVMSGPRGGFGDRDRDRRNGPRGGERSSPSPERPARGPDADTWKR